MNDILCGIGGRLKEWRKANRMTQAETAELLEMSLNFYGDIERGKCRLSIEKIILVYDKLGIDPTYLLTGTKSPTVGFYDIIKDCPKDKIFDMEQIVRYASNLYRKNNKND
ncbi:MAG: helix-turn-helix transcriptional regulator [Oscillospiraceae bacterium]|nr:helix-turn-helix transcriptional regulator [Oscillospiraceae bacterium]